MNSSMAGPFVAVARTVFVAAVAFGTVGVVALFSGAAVAGGLGSPRAAGAVGTPIAWGPCDPPGPGLQCARIRVPLDWDRPKGRTIRLAVIRHLASKPDERIGTMFFNPGGPGDSGVGVLHVLGDDLDKWGGGRFDVVSWDPRGTNASTRVNCFRNERSESRFWAGQAAPTTNAASKPFARKIAALARRCAEVSGWLLPHISTADTARDLDHLRVLMGEEKLTYFGFSYGTYLGQTYANMFPDRIRAMLLDGLVDPTKWSQGAEMRTAGLVASTDEVHDRLLSLCEGAGPERCALAGGDQTAAERFKRLSKRLKRAPIPAPGVQPPLSSTQKLTYGDMLVSQAAAVSAPGTWPESAASLAAALRGRRIGARERSGLAQRARRLGEADDRGGDQLRRRARDAEAERVAEGDSPVQERKPPQGQRGGLDGVGPLRGMARSRRGQLPRSVDRHYTQPDPAHQPAL